MVLGQIMPAANADPSIKFDTYVCKENEVIFYCPVYNKSTGFYGGLTAFKKHFSYLLDQNQNHRKSSGMFLYLPSTLDCKEDFLK